MFSLVTLHLFNFEACMVLLNLELAVQLCWLASQPQRSTPRALGLQVYTTMLEFYMGTRNLNSDPLRNPFFYMGAEDLNSDPNASTIRALLAESSSL